MTTAFNLKGKTVLITGASKGLGVQFARSFNNAGARVLLAARNQEKLKSLVSELVNAKSIEMDVSNKKSVAHAFHNLEKDGEKIDVCVNNAATATLTPIFEEDNDNSFESIIQTNLIGVWYVTKASANHMKNKGIYGSIINIGSVNGNEQPSKEITAYAVSKAGMMHMVRSLVQELAQYNIRINALNLGPIQSHLLGSSYEHKWDFWQNKIPIGFIGHPSDLESIILYLASNNASQYVTGSCFTIDGGMSWGNKLY